MEFKIGGFNVRVVENDTLESERDLYGEYSHRLLEIRVAKGLPPDLKNSTVIHEIVEAANVIYCLKLKHSDIELLETALYQILKDNKGLLLEMFGI